MQRPLLGLAMSGDEQGLISSLKEEEEKERAADRAYWLPLKQELERLRQQARSQRGPATAENPSNAG